MTQIAVQCDSVNKQYANKYALKEFSVSIPAGRVVGILGPNGSGKSTFFRMITGLVQPDSGQIEVFSKTPSWQTNRKIAYLPDRARWYPKHTVAQAFDWAQQFMPGFIIEEARQLAEDMDLDKDMLVSGMSRGQEARLMFILCIARRVPLIVLDEPFSGIDVISREQIIEGMIDYLSEQKQTILISTHELFEVEGLFDYAFYLNQGKVVLSGEVEHLRMEYGSMHNMFRSYIVEHSHLLKMRGFLGKLSTKEKFTKLTPQFLRCEQSFSCYVTI